METILQHFRKEEQPFIEMAAGWIREVENMYAPKLTDFLDPRQRHIVQSLAKNSGLHVGSNGGFIKAERQRMLIYPDYYESSSEDYQIAVFQIQYAVKFLTLQHKDILGSLMSLGLDRSKFGDIQIDYKTVQFAAADEIYLYVETNMTSIGQAKVHVQKVEEAAHLIQSADEWEETTYIISSLRLDALIAKLLNISRQKAAAIIHSEKVKVNWALRNHPAMELQEADMISVRGSGRFKIMAIEGRTKKDKIKLLIGRLL